MKKKIIIGIFLLLIFITAIVSVIGAINTYKFEMANDDLFVGLGAVMAFVVGGFAVFYELDLFYTVYYFFLKPKRISKSILNILSNVTLFLIFFSDDIAHTLYKHISDVFGEEIILLIILFLLYIVFRVVCAMIPYKHSVRE